MLEAKNVLTIGIDYRVVHGGVAAVENVYSTFYKPFNHITTVVDYGAARKLLAFIKAYLLFWKWMVFHKEIDIVHVHGASYASFWRKRILINIAKMFDKKIVYHCHGAEFKCFSSQHYSSVVKTLQKCDKIIALSESWKNWFENSMGVKKVVVIRNVIEPPCEAKINHDTFTIIFLGRVGNRKGIYDLLDVIVSNKSEFEGKLNFLYGGDGDVDKVEAIVKAERIENIVKYQGWVDKKKKQNLLNIADAFVLPSYNEGLPISVLEAMSYSLPIISTAVGGIPEILKDGENGFLIYPGDKEALSQSIKALMYNKKLRVQMGKKSKVLVKEHLPIYVEAQLKQLYDSL